MPASPKIASISTPQQGALLFGLECRSGRGIVSGMARGDTFDFHPRPGRLRDRGARAGGRSRSFVAQVMAAAAKENGGPLTPAQMRGERRSRGSGGRPRKGRCSRIGRGQAAADRLKRAAAVRGPGERDSLTARVDAVLLLSLIHISEPTRPY